MADNLGSFCRIHKYNYFLIPNLTAWNTRIYISAAKRMDFNKWYHVAITYNGNVTKAYINGECVGQNAAGGIT